MSKYNKAVASSAAAVIGILALFGVDASNTVDTIAQAILVLIPLIVAAAPKNAE